MCIKRYLLFVNCRRFDHESLYHRRTCLMQGVESGCNMIDPRTLCNYLTAIPACNSKRNRWRIVGTVVVLLCVTNVGATILRTAAHRMSGKTNPDEQFANSRTTKIFSVCTRHRYFVCITILACVSSTVEALKNQFAFVGSQFNSTLVAVS